MVPRTTVLAARASMNGIGSQAIGWKPCLQKDLGKMCGILLDHYIQVPGTNHPLIEFLQCDFCGSTVGMYYFRGIKRCVGDTIDLQIIAPSFNHSVKMNCSPMILGETMRVYNSFGPSTWP
jgi:hypothetical protein